jgi:hypothetical protein
MAERQGTATSVSSQMLARTGSARAQLTELLMHTRNEFGVGGGSIGPRRNSRTPHKIRLCPREASNHDHRPASFKETNPKRRPQRDTTNRGYRAKPTAQASLRLAPRNPGTPTKHHPPDSTMQTTKLTDLPGSAKAPFAPQLTTDYARHVAHTTVTFPYADGRLPHRVNPPTGAVGEHPANWPNGVCIH